MQHGGGAVTSSATFDETNATLTIGGATRTGSDTFSVTTKSVVDTTRTRFTFTDQTACASTRW